jgi:hypothetical protein
LLAFGHEDRRPPYVAPVRLGTTLYSTLPYGHYDIRALYIERKTSHTHQPRLVAVGSGYADLLVGDPRKYTIEGYPPTAAELDELRGSAPPGSLPFALPERRLALGWSQETLAALVPPGTTSRLLRPGRTARPPSSALSAHPVVPPVPTVLPEVGPVRGASRATDRSEAVRPPSGTGTAKASGPTCVARRGERRCPRAVDRDELCLRHFYDAVLGNAVVRFDTGRRVRQPPARADFAPTGGYCRALRAGDVCRRTISAHGLCADHLAKVRQGTTVFWAESGSRVLVT